MVISARDAAMQRRQRKQPERESGEDRDVAAGNRDDVVRAGALEPVGHLIRQPGPVADEHGGDDRRGGFVVRRDPRADGRADARAHTGGPFLEWRDPLATTSIEQARS